MSKLNYLEVQRKPPGKYVDGNGLMLDVKPSGARYWFLRIQSQGRRRDFGLGSATEIRPAEARMKALQTRKLVLEGIDPSELRKRPVGAAEAPKTFREAAVMAHSEFSPSWSNVKHRNQWLHSLETYAYPTLGHLPVEDVDGPRLVASLRGIWRTHEETARRVRQRICAVLDWAHANGLRTSECPKSGVTKGLGSQTRRPKHHAALDIDDGPKLMRSLVKSQPVSRLALRFLILTAARSGEVRGATWSEIDISGRKWTIPAERMKARKPHAVPLSAGAVGLLKAAARLRLGGEPDYVFPSSSGKPLSDTALRKTLRDQGYGNVTVHGFRSTFRLWTSKKGKRDAVAEAALAHTNKNRTEAAYLRTDFFEERKSMMQEWDDFMNGDT